MRIRSLVASASLIGLSLIASGPALADPAVAPTVSVDGDTGIVSWPAFAGDVQYYVRVSHDGGVTWFESFALTPVGATRVSLLGLRGRTTRSASCAPTGPCSIIVQVGTGPAINDAVWGPSSAPASVPEQYVVPRHAFRTKQQGKNVLYLYGGMPTGGVRVNLMRLMADHTWQKVGRTVVTKVQRLPGHAHRSAMSYVFKIVLTKRGINNFRMQIDPAGILGNGLSQPYGVLR